MAEQDSQLQQTNKFLDLSPEIYDVIAENFSAPYPLFVPYYGPPNEMLNSAGLLQWQHDKYYGTAYTKEQESASESLLNWSATCSRFRSLLAPRLFRNVVVRTRAKSIASIEALSKSPHWESVQGITVCLTFNAERDIEQPLHRGLDDLDVDCLSPILSHLPESLKYVTLDFPWDWDDDGESMTEEDQGDGGFLPEYAPFIHAMLHALGQNDMSQRSGITLNLLNLPKAFAHAGDTGSFCTSASFQWFLGQLAGFKLSICNWDGACWKLTTQPGISRFTRGLGNAFINHLGNVKMLTLEANDSSPIGLAFELDNQYDSGHHLDFPALSPSLRLDRVQNLTMSYFFLSPELIIFLTVNLPNIEHLSLICCFGCSDHGLCECEDRPSWQEVFVALKNGAHSLQSLKLQHRYDDIGLVYYEQDTPCRRDEKNWTALDEIKTVTSRQYFLRDEEWTRRKRVLPHNFLNDKYGHLQEDEELNAQRYLSGEDHAALLELWDAMVGRGGKGVTYLLAVTLSPEHLWEKPISRVEWTPN